MTTGTMWLPVHLTDAVHPLHDALAPLRHRMYALLLAPPASAAVAVETPHVQSVSDSMHVVSIESDSSSVASDGDEEGDPMHATSAEEVGCAAVSSSAASALQRHPNPTTKKKNKKKKKKKPSKRHASHPQTLPMVPSPSSTETVRVDRCASSTSTVASIVEHGVWCNPNGHPHMGTRTWQNSTSSDDALSLTWLSSSAAAPSPATSVHSLCYRCFAGELSRPQRQQVYPFILGVCVCVCVCVF